MYKLVKRNRKYEDEWMSKAFVKITKNKYSNTARFNILASKLFDDNTKKVDVFTQNGKIYIKKNNNNGDYFLTRVQRGNSFHFVLSCMSLMNVVGDIDFNNRYEVEKEGEYIVFMLS
jgi:hypothetical protein